MSEDSPKEESHPGGFFIRACAHAIDVMIIFLLFLPLSILILRDVIKDTSYQTELTQALESHYLMSIPAQIILNLVPVVIVVLLWRWKSATPGKMLFKLKVLDADTLDRPSTKQCIIRVLGYIPPCIPLLFATFWLLEALNEMMMPSGRSTTTLMFLTLATSPLFIGFLRIIWNDRKQGWHDTWAKTVVMQGQD